jgi:putative transposase
MPASQNQSRCPSILCLLLIFRGWLRAFRGQAASYAALQAENLFLRKQLAMLIERNQRPRRPRWWDRIVLATVSCCFSWADALVVVKPATLIRWHREGFRLLWRWKSRGGRPRLPHSIRRLAVAMAKEKPSWSAQRIANELSTKLGLGVSEETIRKYLPFRPRGNGRGDQRWMTFVRNHTSCMLACDFLVTVTANFRILYVLVIMELGSRRILLTNVTANPTAEWTMQQLRNVYFDIEDKRFRFLIHDRSPYFSLIDQKAKDYGLRALKTPICAPTANAFCERLIGTIRRECLRWMIPINERHLRAILREWVPHYNRQRPHLSLGPGFPEPSEDVPAKPQSHRHRLPPGARVVARPILGGLHHEYRLDHAA